MPEYNEKKKLFVFNITYNVKLSPEEGRKIVSKCLNSAETLRELSEEVLINVLTNKPLRFNCHSVHEEHNEITDMVMIDIKATQRQSF